MLPKAWSHTDPLGSRNKVVEAPYKKSRFLRRLFLKDWRQPTLAESIKPLPSARLCLTAEFGMGSGRTTALWPPKIGIQCSVFQFANRGWLLTTASDKEQCR